MSYKRTRRGREVTYERLRDERIDLYLYFSSVGKKISGSHGVQPEDVIFEVREYIVHKLGSEQLPTQQAELLGEAVGELGEAIDSLVSASEFETKKGGGGRGVQS